MCPSAFLLNVKNPHINDVPPFEGKMNEMKMSGIGPEIHAILVFYCWIGWEEELN
jgi:hypothetical protein